MNTKIFFAITSLLFVFIFLSSCEKDPEIENSKVISISGVVQKGPFNAGASITLYELNEKLIQTGKSFDTQIIDENGAFELKDIELTSQYVLIKADGFYFNEISGENSDTKLTLYALSDITNRNTLNVNILSHLEKPRVENLISNGSSLKEAKITAQQEILKVFNINSPDLLESETLDFTSNGKNNAILLAISSLLQGFRSVGELSELLSQVSNDLKEDGTLDAPALQTTLISQGVYVNPEMVKHNLIEKYTAINMAENIPDFQSYIEQFLINSAFLKEELIQYPEQSLFGINILSSSNSEFKLREENIPYSMYVEPFKGLSTKIELSVISGEVGTGAWMYRSNDVNNWKVYDYNHVEHKQIFEVIDSSKTADLNIVFMAKNITVEIKYFEGTVVRSREIKVLSTN